MKQGYQQAVREASGAPLRKEDYERLAAFRYTLRRFLRFSEQAAQRAGITPQQHQALLAIKGFPEREQVTIGELAEWLQLRHHSTVELVNRLEAQGLVARSHATDDRRQVNLALTAHGEEMLAGLSTVHRAELRQIGSELKQLLEQVNNGENHGESNRSE